jgi:hypothetical protein
MHLELIILGLASMVAPVLAKLANYETGRKPFDLCGVAGIFFLLAAACGVGVVTPSAALLETLRQWGSLLSLTLGWLALAVGAIWGALDVIREPDRNVAHANV